MDSKTLFPSISDSEERQSIRSVLLVQPRIPTLNTLLEDSKYLVLGARIVKELIPDPKGKELRDWFIKQNLGEDRLEAAYREVFLFAMRNFPDLISARTKKSPGVAAPDIKVPDEACWRALMHTCSRLDLPFSTPQRLLRRVADAAALEPLSPERAAGWDVADAAPVTSDDFERVRLLERSGIPFTAHFVRARPQLSYRNVFGEIPATPGVHATGFVFLREIIRAFFGPLGSQGIRAASSNYSEPAMRHHPLDLVDYQDLSDNPFASDLISAEAINTLYSPSVESLIQPGPASWQGSRREGRIFSDQYPQHLQMLQAIEILLSHFRVESQIYVLDRDRRIVALQDRSRFAEFMQECQQQRDVPWIPHSAGWKIVTTVDDAYNYIRENGRFVCLNNNGQRFDLWNDLLSYMRPQPNPTSGVPRNSILHDLLVSNLPQ